MQDTELEQLLANHESDRVERKASISDPGKIRQAICAFANDLPDHRQPGVVFIGVDDAGKCTDLSITDRLLLTLADMKADGNITPFPSLAVSKRTLSGCELAVVVVRPSDAPPVRYKGRVWIRVGPRRELATPEEERRLAEKRRAKDLPFDVHRASSATLEDLDLEFFERIYLPTALPSDVLEQNQRSLEHQLLSKRMTVAGNLDDSWPTVLGLMAIGRTVRDHLPGAYIQFLRIDGQELTDPIKDQKEIEGHLLELIRQLDETIRAHISTATDITSSTREIRHPDYPIVALQQLTRNAILHRNYEGTHAPVRVTWFSDRIEILSPGGPFGNVTRESLGQPGVTDYRNPHLAEAMKDLGFVQRFGMGIPLARQELKRNGNPPLRFEVEPSHVLAVVEAKP